MDFHDAAVVIGYEISGMPAAFPRYLLVLADGGERGSIRRGGSLVLARGTG
jgi:hypothetical protein